MYSFGNHIDPNQLLFRGGGGGAVVGPLANMSSSQPMLFWGEESGMPVIVGLDQVIQMILH